MTAAAIAEDLADQYRRARDRGDHAEADRLAAEWCRPTATATTAKLDRLRADLARYPDSPTLNAYAQRDASGMVVGWGLGSDLLACAYDAGAPAALIVDAEQLSATVAKCRRQFSHAGLGVRLAHRVRAVNAALGRWVDNRHALPTVVIRAPAVASVVEPVVVELAAVDLDRIDAGADPPDPLTAPTTAPVLRHGPPVLAGMRGPEQLAPAVLVPTFGMEGAALAA